METKLSKFLTIFSLFIAAKSMMAQSCGSCTVNINSIDTSAYTVNTGQVFCIDTLGKFTGTLIINGGSVCNRGVFYPKLISVSTGTITNYGRVTLGSSFTLSSGTDIVNKLRSSVTVKGNLTIGGGLLNNLGILNVKNNITYSAGTFNNTAIVNCKVLSGAAVTSVTNSGIINKD